MAMANPKCRRALNVLNSFEIYVCSYFYCIFLFPQNSSRNGAQFKSGRRNNPEHEVLEVFFTIIKLQNFPESPLPLSFLRTIFQFTSMDHASSSVVEAVIDSNVVRFEPRFFD